MSTDAPLNLPQKKRSILWLIAGVFLLLLGIFFFQLFGPDPPIIVSPQTTCITEPLGPDGVPDYERHLLELYRGDATPENNAAVLLWKALGPGDLDSRQYQAIRKEIGLVEIPAAEDVLQPLTGPVHRERVKAWLIEQGHPDDDDDFIDKLAEVPLEQPWTTLQFPPVAEWIHANQTPVDLIAEGVRRSRYYSPSSSLIGASREPLVVMQFPGQHAARGAAQSLLARAMWHLGEGRSAKAWQDVLALHRLARLIGQGHTIVEQVRAISISDLACDGTVVLLHHGTFTASELAEMQRELKAMPDFSSAAHVLDQGERIAFLDIILKLTSANAEETRRAIGFDDVPVIDTLAVDWNTVLAAGNDYFDRLALAARLPEGRVRWEALERIDADREQSASEIKRPMRLLSGLFSRKNRSHSVAKFMIEVIGSSMPLAVIIQDRANTKLRLTRLAAALARYRAEHGQYPEALSELQPVAIDKLPIDMYSDQPFIYVRDEDTNGYLLYSVFVNGKDDGGTDVGGMIVSGQWMPEKMPVDYNTESDLVIRIPRPAFELPKAAPRPDGP